MADELKKPGDPLRIPAKVWNDLTRLLRSENDVGVQPAGGRRFPPAWVQNCSGSAVGWGRALAVREPVVTASACESEFLNRVMLKGYTANSSDVSASPQRIAVLVEPLSAGPSGDATNGPLGEAIVDGLVPCYVNVTNTAHRYAALTSGQTYLTSRSAPGPAEIVWAAGGTGQQWCVVRLLGGGGDSGIIVEEVDGSPSYTSITTLQVPSGSGIATNPSTGVALLNFATASIGGFVSTTSQTFAGTKTFSEIIATTSVTVDGASGGSCVISTSGIVTTDLTLTCYGTAGISMATMPNSDGDVVIPFQWHTTLGAADGGLFSQYDAGTRRYGLVITSGGSPYKMFWHEDDGANKSFKIPSDNAYAVGSNRGLTTNFQIIDVTGTSFELEFKGGVLTSYTETTPGTGGMTGTVP